MVFTTDRVTYLLENQIEGRLGEMRTEMLVRWMDSVAGTHGAAFIRQGKVELGSMPARLDSETAASHIENFALAIR